MDVSGVDSMGNLDSMLEDDDEDLEVKRRQLYTLRLCFLWSCKVE
jgi:hypothetical protein